MAWHKMGCMPARLLPPRTARPPAHLATRLPTPSAPAQMRTVKRPGPNNGRQFWSCGKFTMVAGAGCDFFKFLDEVQQQAPGAAAGGAGCGDAGGVGGAGIAAACAAVAAAAAAGGGRQEGLV